MLLHNGVSFVAGIIVAAGVLMLLVALEWVIREACLGKQRDSSSSSSSNSEKREELAATNDNSKNKVLLEKSKKVAETIYTYIRDRWTLGVTASDAPPGIDPSQKQQTDISLDQLVVSVAICKLLLAWNSDSDWSLLPVRNNGIRVFFVLLYLLHLNSVFKGAAILLDNVARDLNNNFMELLSVVASLIVVSVLSSDAAYLLLNDEVSAFGLHSKAFGSEIEDAILAAIYCSLAMLMALTLACCLSSMTVMMTRQQQQQSSRFKKTGKAMRFVLFAGLNYVFTVVTGMVPSASFTYYSIQFFVIAAHVLERLLLL